MKLIKFRKLISGDSSIKKAGGHCGTKEKVGGHNKCLSCMVVFRWFED